jgi:hypothetical protein
VALAAAAAIVAFAADRARPVQSERGQPSLPLAMLAADGDPAVLWQSVGIEADPVLALIALQDAQR